MHRRSDSTIATRFLSRVPRFGWSRAFALALAVTAVGRAQLQGQERSLNERVPVNPDVMIRIHNMVGSVRVRAWDRDSIAVTGTVNETKLDRFQIHAGGAGTKLGIWDSNSEGLGPSHLQIMVPTRSTVWIKTASATIDVTGVRGGLDLYSVSGDIAIAGTPREVYAESMGGRITLSAETRSARIKTGSGAISLGGNLVDVTATTVSGPVDIDGPDIERGRIESVDGRITWRGAFMNHASLDFTSHAGPIEFVLNRQASASFTVSTFEGRLDDQWGLRVQQGGSKLKGRELRFSIGDGSATVVARTFKAPVIVRRTDIQTLPDRSSSY
jgi:hypothetical protein